MSDSPVLDGGARFPEVMTIRLPPGFLARIRRVSEGEAIAPRDFVRRAVSERLIRLEQAEAPTSDRPPASAATSPPSANTLSARGAGTPTTSRASASATASTRRRDA